MLIDSCICPLIADNRLLLEETDQATVLHGLLVHFLLLFFQLFPLLFLLGDLLDEILLPFLQLLQDTSGDEQDNEDRKAYVIATSIPWLHH